MAVPLHLRRAGTASSHNIPKAVVATAVPLAVTATTVDPQRHMVPVRRHTSSPRMALDRHRAKAALESFTADSRVALLVARAVKRRRTTRTATTSPREREDLVQWPWVSSLQTRAEERHSRHLL